MLRLWFFLVSILSIFPSENFSYQTENSTHVRNKRFLPLVFLNSSAITFITGFGIPVHNLNPELVTVGMVLKAQQFLPATNADLRRQTNHSIHKRESIVNKINYRFLFYKSLEQLSISLGQNGSACVLKTICEMASYSFHYQNGVLGEIIHILLTPSSSIDVYEASEKYNFYLKAEQIGRRKLKCDQFNRNCEQSILNRVTNIFD